MVDLRHFHTLDDDVRSIGCQRRFGNPYHRLPTAGFTPLHGNVEFQDFAPAIRHHRDRFVGRDVIHDPEQGLPGPSGQALAADVVDNSFYPYRENVPTFPGLTVGMGVQ